MVPKVGERMTKVGGGVPKLERGAQIGGGNAQGGEWCPRWVWTLEVGYKGRLR